MISFSTTSCGPTDCHSSAELRSGVAVTPNSLIGSLANKLHLVAKQDKGEHGLNLSFTRTTCT